MSAISFAPDEAQEIARALAAVAAADGAIQQREASVLDEFAMSHSVGGITFIPEQLDVDKLARAIRGDDERREVLRLCIRMALADGDYAPRRGARDRDDRHRLRRALPRAANDLRQRGRSTLDPVDDA